MSPSSLSPRPPLPWLAKLGLALLGALIVGFCFLLWPEWRSNPDLSHGLFMPLLFLLMLHESRAQTFPRYLSAGLKVRLLTTALILLGLLALVVAGLYAAALGWSHTLVEFLLAISLVGFLGAGLFAFSDERVRWLPCNWSSVVATGLWLLSTPLPPGTYTRLTLGLQLLVSQSVLGALNLLGVAAHRTGNIIELAHGSVGVEEACSGVRSLLSCVFAGFFLSATLVRSMRARMLIVTLAGPLALAMNFIRSLALTLLANSGMNLADRWHDITGYAVLGITAVILAVLALRLERAQSTVRSSLHGSTPDSAVRLASGSASISSPRTSMSFALLATALVVSLGLIVFFAVNTRSRPKTGSAAPPDLAAMMPPVPSGWSADSPRDLYRFTGLLQTEHLAQRTYTGRSATGGPIQITLYLAYWPAGQSTVSRVAAHTPDACWPGSGWTAQTVAVTRENPVIERRTLPTAEYRFFKNGDYPQHVWFWHLFEGRPIVYQNPYSTRELFHLALQYGFRHDGDQFFVRVSSTATWSEISSEPFLREFFARLQLRGL